MTDAQTFQLLIGRLDGQDEKLDEILSEVKRTNGRVTVLERDKAIREDRAERQVRSSDKRRGLLADVLAGVGTLALVASAVVGLLNVAGLA